MANHWTRLDLLQNLNIIIKLTRTSPGTCGLTNYRATGIPERNTAAVKPSVGVGGADRLKWAATNDMGHPHLIRLFAVCYKVRSLPPLDLSDNYFVGLPRTGATSDGKLGLGQMILWTVKSRTIYSLN